MTENKDENLEIHEIIENGIDELVIRRGDAEVLHHPKNCSISGTISAPGVFISERNADFEKNKSHCIVSREGKRLHLVLKEQSEVGAYHITGIIKVGSKFTALGINDSSISYTPMELSKKLKMMRSIFVSRGEHATVVNALKQIKAKLNQIVESQDDSRGNTSASFEQTLESNVPEKFALKLPLLEGEEVVEFEVNVFIEGNTSGSLKCYLESMDAADLIEEAVDKRIDEEIKIINQYAVVIES